jgi:hypothetical protein
MKRTKNTKDNTKNFKNLKSKLLDLNIYYKTKLLR